MKTLADKLAILQAEHRELRLSVEKQVRGLLESRIPAADAGERLTREITTLNNLGVIIEIARKILGEADGGY